MGPKLYFFFQADWFGYISFSGRPPPGNGGLSFSDNKLGPKLAENGVWIWIVTGFFSQIVTGNAIRRK